MKTEKIVLALVAICAGLLVAGVAFYLYQSTKVIQPSGNTSVSVTPATPTPLPDNNALSIQSPENESVTDKRTIVLTGTTVKGATIAIVGENTDLVVTPTQNGTFSASVTITEGQNIIEITALLPNGQEYTKTLTITSSTENF